MSDLTSIIFNWNSISLIDQIIYQELYGFHGRRVNFRTLPDDDLRMFHQVLPDNKRIDFEIRHNRPQLLSDDRFDFLFTVEPDNLVYYNEILRRTESRANNTIVESSARLNALLQRPDLLPENWEQQRIDLWRTRINSQEPARDEEGGSRSERRGSLVERLRGLVPPALGGSRHRGSRASGRESFASQTASSAATIQSPNDTGSSQPASLLRDRFSAGTSASSTMADQNIGFTRPRSVRRYSSDRPELPTMVANSSMPPPPPDDRPPEQRGTPYLVRTSSGTQPSANTQRFSQARFGASTSRQPPQGSLEQRGRPNPVQSSSHAQSRGNPPRVVFRGVHPEVLARVKAFGRSGRTKRAASESSHSTARPPRRARSNAVNRDLRLEETGAPHNFQEPQSSHRPSGTPSETQHPSTWSSSSSSAHGDMEMEDAEDSVTQDTTNTQQPQSQRRLSLRHTQEHDLGITDGRRLSFQELLEVQAELPPRYDPSTQIPLPGSFARHSFPPANREGPNTRTRPLQDSEFDPFAPLEHLVDSALSVRHQRSSSSVTPSSLPPPAIGTNSSIRPMFWPRSPGSGSNFISSAPLRSGGYEVRPVVNRDEDDVSPTSSMTLANGIEVEMIEDRDARAPSPTPVDRQTWGFGIGLEEHRSDVSYERPTFQHIENVAEDVEMDEDRARRTLPATRAERESGDFSTGTEEWRTDLSYERPTFEHIEHADSIVGRHHQSQLLRSSSSSPVTEHIEHAEPARTVSSPPLPSFIRRYGNNNLYIGRVDIVESDTTQVFRAVQQPVASFPLLPPPALPLTVDTNPQSPANRDRNPPPRLRYRRLHASVDIRNSVTSPDNQVNDSGSQQFPNFEAPENPEHSEPPIGDSPPYQASSGPSNQRHVFSADDNLGVGQHIWTGDGMIAGVTPQNERRDPFDHAVGEVEEGTFDENGEWVRAPLTRERVRIEGDLVDFEEDMGRPDRGRMPERVQMGNNMVSPYPRQEEERQRESRPPRRRLSSFFRQRGEANNEEGRGRRSFSWLWPFRRRSNNRASGSSSDQPS